MVADTRARTLSITINSKDYSNKFLRFETGFASIAAGGVEKMAELTIASNTRADIDPLLNPDDLRPGVAVAIQVANDAGTLIDHPLGSLVILEEPKQPLSSENRTTLSLGCNLAYQDYDEPDDDQSGVIVGTARNLAAIATGLLELHIPPTEVNLGSWEYSSAAPLEKESGGFVGQAKELAYSSDWRYLYCDKDGIVQSRLLDIAPSSAIATYTIGTNEVYYEPLNDKQKPVEVVRTVATKRTSEDSENPRTDIDVLLGDLSTLTESVPSQRIEIIQTTQTTETIGVSSEITEITITAIGALIPNATFPTNTYPIEETTGTRRFDGQDRLIEETVSSDYARGIVNPDETELSATQPIDGLESTLRINYDSINGVILSREYREQKNKISINSGESSLPYQLIDSLVVIESWDEVTRGRWKHAKTTQAPKILANPNLESATANYGLTVVNDPNQTFVKTKADGSTQPPQIEYRAATSNVRESLLEGKAEFDHRGGATDRERPRPFQVPYGFTEAQMNAIAKKQGALLTGRHQGKLIQVPISNALLAIDYPLPRIDVDEGSITRSYIADALTYIHENERAYIQFAGIWVGDLEGGAIAPPYIEKVRFNAGFSIGASFRVINPVAESQVAFGYVMGAQFNVIEPVLFSSGFVMGAQFNVIEPISFPSGFVIGANFNVFEPETAALLNEFAGSYSDARKIEINRLIKSLKDDSLWTTFDGLWIAGLTEADSLINWVDPSGTSATNNSMSFTADRGFTGNGTTAYIDTPVNLSTASNFAQNSGTVFFYGRSNSQGSYYDIQAASSGGDSNETAIASWWSTNGTFIRVNQLAGALTSGLQRSDGLFSACRTGSTAISGYRNGSLIGSTSSTSQSAANKTLKVAVADQASGFGFYSPRQYAAFGVGSGWNSTQNSNFNTALDAYLDHIGASV